MPPVRALPMKYKSDLQDYNDQNTYLDGVRAATASSEYERHIRAYDTQGRLAIDQGLKDDGSIKTMMVNDSFDGAGNVVTYHTDAMANDHIRSDYANTYRTLTNGVVQASSTGHITVLSGQLSGKTGSNATSTNVYDASGNLVGVDYSTAGDAPKSGTSKKIFIVDAHGNILLTREQSWNSPTAEQRQILVGDELELRYSINYGSFGDIQDEQKSAFWEAYNADAYQSMVTPGGTITAEAGSNPTTGQVVVVHEGDTLQSLAQRVYGAADAWYRLAEANNLGHDSVLVAGTTLVAPAATGNTNALDFNMGKLVGSTAPNLPPPPPDKNNCLTLIIVAVAVVVACIVAPTMGKFAVALMGKGMAATVIAGGLTAAAANVASQTVGIVAGVQDGMNWRGVAKAAIGGAIGAGIGSVTGLTSSSFVHTTLNNIASQVMLIAAHQQEKFSWATVAAAAVSAGVANSDVMDGIQNSMEKGGWSAFAQGAVKSGLSRFVGSLTTDLIIPGKQDWAQIGISTFEGALSSGLESQRQNNFAHNKPFLFDDAPPIVSQPAEKAAWDSFDNALGSSLAESMRPTGQQAGELTDAQRAALAAGYSPLTDEAAQQKLSVESGFEQKSNVPAVGNDSETKAHRITQFSDADILNGRSKPVSYSTANIDSKNRTIDIQVKIDYQTPGALNISAGSVTDEQYAKYVGLANAGIEKYWSRDINLNGESWRVNVTATNSNEGMPIKVANPGASWMGDFSSRSFNGYPYKEGTLYYDSSYGSDSDAMYSLTSAHEIGHSFLTSAFGIGWSWRHEGTSTSGGNIFANAPQYPTTGEIGLMPYYSRNATSPVYRRDILQRTIASENDVKTLLYISGRRH
jgi:LysM repeat protein